MSLSAIPIAIRRQVFERDAGQCCYCHLVQIGQSAVFHINHIVPRSKGGTTELENLALQCPNCSLHKSDKVQASDTLTGEFTPLFHPLRQQWGDHFFLDRDGTCRGTTAIGRVTIEALHMNDPLPRIARSIQISIGLLLSSP